MLAEHEGHLEEVIEEDPARYGQKQDDEELAGEHGQVEGAQSKPCDRE